jgi:small-conductance mechanosensitive channel
MSLNELSSYYYHLHPLLQIAIILVLAIIGGEVLRRVLNLAMRTYKKRSGDEVLAESSISHLRPVMKLLLPLILFNIALDTVALPENTLHALHSIIGVLLTATVAWLFIQIIAVIEDLIFHNYDIEKADNYLARKVHTQVQFIKRLLIVAIFIIALSTVLLRFEGVRSIGAGLLTSAGVTGIIIGFAAQRSIANLIAGFQIAFTQPIRIDDVLIVEGEWGRVEEITFTYVVLRIWDQRRLIIPINHFIEKPFQNWTRSSADILGTVFLYTDYFVPMEELRKELRRVCEASPYWDKRVCVVQVTDARESTMEIRALVSAENSGNAWELRVDVREKLLDFLRRNYPESLPRTRVVLEGSGSQGRDSKLPIERPDISR